MKRMSLVLVVLLAFACSAFAQVQGGSVTGTVRDEQGGVLPGVIVTLQGVDATRTLTTESTGEFRFLNLPPGPYKLTTTLPGFTTTVQENIIVEVGKNVDLPVSMKVAAVAETITVTGASPIIDTKKTGTDTNFTMDELTKVPTSRDPWALMRTVPGVMVDRVNIAGNETGQQSNFQSKGTRSADAVWTMDGVVITDMAAIGASPTYFNYDNFEEIQVSTSGQDIKQQTGGVGLNFIVKRGTNTPHGAARGYFTNHNLEASNVPAELAAKGVTPATADHNQQISDWGLDYGGPIWRDNAWVYASYSTQDIRLLRQSGNFIDKTLLKTTNIKGNWQASDKDMISVLWFLGAKEKSGRSPGTAGILRDAETATWNQGGAYSDGKPHGLLKFEDSRTFSSSIFVSGRYAYYNTGFQLSPAGGLDQQAGESVLLGQSFGSTRRSLNLRPQHTANADGNYFFNAGGTHDLKFGFGWRRADGGGGTLWPGNMILAREESATDFRARIFRESFGNDRAKFTDLYVGDTITRDRLTIDLGVRYDRQWGEALPSSTASNKAFSSVVPGIQFAGYQTPFTWSNVSPRAGVTVALDEARKTIVRASYSRYAGQLQTGYVGYMNPSGNTGFIEVPWIDLNRDHLAQANEVNPNIVLAFGGGFDPANPTAVTSASRIDPNLKNPITQSAVAGVEREVLPNLAVQVNYSFTRTSDWIYEPWRGDWTRSDYIQTSTVTGSLPNGQAYSVPIFAPNAAKVAANGNGRILSNWPGYYSYYHGIEGQVIKRMSNKWMARVGAAWNNPRENYGDNPRDFWGNPTRRDEEPLVNGGAFVVRSSGSGSGDIFIHGKWQFNASGVYQLPHGLEAGANVFGRQGYPFPLFRNVSLGLDATRRVLVTPQLDTFRFPSLWDLDLRLSENVKMARGSFRIVADLFNVFNSNTELVRNRNITSPAFNDLAQNLSPRILRFGVVVGF